MHVHGLKPVATLGLAPLLMLALAAGPAPAPTWRPSADPPDSLVAWGRNNEGQLGDGTQASRTTPVPVSRLHPESIKALAAGTSHSLALLGDGSVWAWGDNGVGQLGNDSTAASQAPVRVVGPAGTGVLTDITAIAAGSHHSLALRSDGTVWAWGDNREGQLGDGTNAQRLAPVQVGGRAPLIDIRAIGAGNLHSLAIAVTTRSTVWTWGSNWHGELGNGTSDSSPTPVRVATSSVGGPFYAQVDGGAHFSLALMGDGVVQAWGLNGSGQLGDGTTTERQTPVNVEGLPREPVIQQIAAGAAHSLALSAEVWAWGGNRQGQLGDGTTVDRHRPVRVLGAGGAGYLTNVAEIVAGSFHSLAEGVGATLWTWGWNREGQLGDGTQRQRTAPVEVLRPPPSGTIITPVLVTGTGRIAAGALHNVALMHLP